MAFVAECVDTTPPADGSAFSSCTNVVWVNEVTFSLPDWTLAQYGEVTTAIWLMFACFFAVRAIRKHAV